MQVVVALQRADHRAYGRKACEFLGTKLGRTGKVVALQGALSTVNDRETIWLSFPGASIALTEKTRAPSESCGSV